MKVRLSIFAPALFVLALALPNARAASARQTDAARKAPVTFAEVPPKTSGINWVHDNAHSPERWLPETVGAGCAFFDYDGDGWLDIYLVNSGPSDFYKPSAPPRNALYRNNRDGTFTDVTEKAGVGGPGLKAGRARANR